MCAKAHYTSVRLGMRATGWPSSSAGLFRVQCGFRYFVEKNAIEHHPGAMAERQGVEGLAPRVAQAEAMTHMPTGDHLQHGGSPHDEVEPCDRKVGKEYKTEKPKGEGERRDDIFWGAF
jgi:hypothetical protein